MPAVYHGFLRVAAASPKMRVADCAFNTERIIATLQQAETHGVGVVVFPELCITGYTCADLFFHLPLQQAAKLSLDEIQTATESAFSGVAIVGLPLCVDDQLFNCAAVLHQGRILGIVPKSYLPNYKEFYEDRWFAQAVTARSKSVLFNDEEVPFGADLLFPASDVDALTLGVEICEDLWVPIPPSSFQAVYGATLLTNLSASNVTIAKADYRRNLVLGQSARCVAAYVFSSCGAWESTTDIVFDGHCIIAEDGRMLAESERLQREEALVIADVDLDRIQSDRMKLTSFSDVSLYLGKPPEYRRIPFTLKTDSSTSTGPKNGLNRVIPPHPFVPHASRELNERCHEIFQTQVIALSKRIEHVGNLDVTIGISGGLDSTLALLVTAKTMDALNVPRSRIKAFTMPGFGTTAHTKGNAWKLMEQLGVTTKEVDIREMCLAEMRALDHSPFGISLAGLSQKDLEARLLDLPTENRNDLVFENVQARMRTSILMNSGFVIGTGDVSELALGWCTYNGDHISMYNPNVSIPKTLVKFLVGWAANEEFEGEARDTLMSIVETKISPELLPTGKDGEIVQETEEVIGPYELHDFFLFHFLRYGAPPEKLLFLAQQTELGERYTESDLRRWLTLFLKRFFGSQFKRSCLPDGPKVGSISLSPRGDWRMPSDASGNEWLAGLEG